MVFSVGYFFVMILLELVSYAFNWMHDPFFSLYDYLLKHRAFFYSLAFGLLTGSSVVLVFYACAWLALSLSAT